MPEEEVRTEDQHVRPRWVTIAMAVGAVVAIAIVLLAVFGGAEHGPGRHGG